MKVAPDPPNSIDGPPVTALTAMLISSPLKNLAVSEWLASSPSAQEVETEFPESVSEINNAYKYVHYAKFAPIRAKR